jgi:hypothetical protein
VGGEYVLRLGPAEHRIPALETGADDVGPFAVVKAEERVVTTPGGGTQHFAIEPEFGCNEDEPVPPTIISLSTLDARTEELRRAVADHVSLLFRTPATSPLLPRGRPL